MKLLLQHTLWLSLTFLVVPAAHAEQSSKVEVPQTQNPYIPPLVTLYEQGRYAEAQSRLEKALDWKSNGPQEVVWLKVMQGMLQVELGQGEALESFKQALALDKEAQLPVQGSRRLHKLFEQARNTLGLPADKDLLAEELKQSPRAPGASVSAPPPRRHGWSVGIRGEVDTLGLGTFFSSLTSGEEDAAPNSIHSPFAPAVSLGYTQQKLGGVLTALVQLSPGLRAEGQFHPLTLGWVRPYARVGATAFFAEHDAQGAITFFGGVSARGALGVDVQWNSRMYAFADVAYEHFLTSGDRYRENSLLFSVGVGLFP